MSFTGTLKITDGTTSVSLLAIQTGIHLKEWIPTTPSMKNEGVWGNSPYSDGRILITNAYNNVIDTFNVQFAADDQNDNVKNMRDLIQLLNAMIDYSTDDWQLGDMGTPVWIEARSDCEDEIRYAYLFQWSLTIGSDPYTSPFRARPSAVDNCTLILEHGLWRDNAPGNATVLNSQGYVNTPTSTILTLVPTESDDDAWVSTTGTIITTIGSLNCGKRVADNSKLHMGIRFRNAAIPQGATILDAYFEYTLLSLATVDYGHITLYAQKEINPAAFTTYADFMARTKTMSYKDITINPAITPGVYQVPYLTGIIQEIVNQPGWVSGQDIVILVYQEVIIMGDGNYEEIGSFDTGDPPKLIIEALATGSQMQGVSVPMSTDVLAVGYSVNNQPSDVRRYNAYLNQLSANLLNHLPLSLFPAVPAAGDILYIGSTTPFTNLRFNFVTTGSGAKTYRYMYSTSGGAAAGTLACPLEYPFTLFGGDNGLWTVSFIGPIDWVPQTITDGGGVQTPLLYWIGVKLITVTVPGVVPIVGGQPIYSITWPFWEIAAADVGGDVDALSRFLMIQRDGYISFGGGTAVSYAHNDTLLIGTRHYSRGAEFTPYLNTRYNPTGITFTLGAPDLTLVETSASPSGEVIYWQPGYALAPEKTLGTWVFTTPIAQQYTGTFRVFCRTLLLATVSPGFPEIGLRVRFTDNQQFAPSNIIAQTQLCFGENATIGSGSFELFDMGIISFQNDGGLAYNNFAVELRGINVEHSIRRKIIDLVLFPVDEAVIELATSADGLFAFETPAPQAGYYLTATDILAYGYQPFHDSTMPKEGPYSGVVDENGDLVSPMVTKTVGAFTLKNNARMKLFLFPWCRATAVSRNWCCVFDGRFSKVQQYWLLRGNT